jgi:nucleoside-diphosphate-sugar epimerase
MKKILITGGCGYVGSALVERLKVKNYIKVIDTQWFGNNLKKDNNVEIMKEDIRNLSDNFVDNSYHSVVHLANIANDPSVELDHSLSWEVNVLALKNLVETAIKNNVKKFVYASSGSVYGIKKEDKVVEDLELVPISTYNKTKMIGERVLLSYADKIQIYIIRPATVCGLSPRMRFDVSVNMLTLQALQSKVITIFGGNQIRPNIHIQDMVRVYEHFLENSLPVGIYNAGFENISILDIGKKIQKYIDCRIDVKKDINDPRSYRQSSEKLIKTNFQQQYYVEDAIKDIIKIYKTGNLKLDDSCYTVKWMKEKVLNGNRN